MCLEIATISWDLHGILTGNPFLHATAMWGVPTPKLWLFPYSKYPHFSKIFGWFWDLPSFQTAKMLVNHPGPWSAPCRHGRISGIQHLAHDLLGAHKQHSYWGLINKNAGITTGIWRTVSGISGRNIDNGNILWWSNMAMSLLNAHL